MTTITDEGGGKTDNRTYKIIRFAQKGRNRVIRRGLTLAQAQEWCNDPNTSGDGWFDGYEAE